MDRDTVVRLAKEAGLIPIDATSIEFIQGDAIRFATLIANETLERAAKVCDGFEGAYWSGDGASAASSCSESIRALKE